MTGDPRTSDEVEALVVDRYLESLLSRQPVDTSGVPPELAAGARRLAGALPRFHPSFRFEERLAGRLAEAAATRASGEAGGGALVEFPRRAYRTDAGATGDRPVIARPALIGGVLTSAALSVAGAAFVAWRLTHPTDDAAMARAVRAVARARIA